MNAPEYRLEVDQHGQPRRTFTAFYAEHLGDVLVAVEACAREFLRRGAVVEIQLRQRDRMYERQRRRLNAICGDIARQVDWYGQRLSKDDWRHIMVACYRKEVRTVPGIDGGFVILGASSRDLTSKEAPEVCEYALAFGAARGVVWTVKARHNPQGNRETVVWTQSKPKALPAPTPPAQPQPETAAGATASSGMGT